jgi:hypothetical protein
VNALNVQEVGTERQNNLSRRSTVFATDALYVSGCTINFLNLWETTKAGPQLDNTHSSKANGRLTLETCQFSRP